MRKPYLVALVLASVIPLAVIIGRHAETIAMLSVRPAVVAKVARRPPQPARVASRPQPPPLPLPPPPPRRLLRSLSPLPCTDDPGEVKRVLKRMHGPMGFPQVERLVGRGDDREMIADHPGV
jgi:hypothetical protein